MTSDLALTAVLKDLHVSTGVDEVMLVTMGYSRAAQARTVQLIADHYGMPKRQVSTTGIANL